MKPLMLVGLIALATALAVLLYARKISALREPPDDIAYGLTGIERHLAEGQALNLRLSGVAPELFLYTRLALAPHHVTLIREHENADTVLLITAKGSIDTLSGLTRRIWSATGEKYYYQLLSSR